MTSPKEEVKDRGYVDRCARYYYFIQLFERPDQILDRVRYDVMIKSCLYRNCFLTKSTSLKFLQELDTSTTVGDILKRDPLYLATCASSQNKLCFQWSPAVFRSLKFDLGDKDTISDKTLSLLKLENGRRYGESRMGFS